MYMTYLITPLRRKTWERWTFSWNGGWFVKYLNFITVTAAVRKETIMQINHSHKNGLLKRDADKYSVISSRLIKFVRILRVSEYNDKNEI